ncbi:MAG: polysaccharide biosynthesis tyrosine autokinase [Planctomycetaceae bacterium]|nr:polysaccharide biosynthesis tyrosine autokinase [Planctomycetaceae bacterium]
MQNQSQEANWNALDNMSDDDEGLDIWGFLRRRKAFVILLSLVGAGLGYLYFQKQTPMYRSSTLLQVIHHNSDPRVENLMSERNLSDAQFVITSNKLLKDAILNHNLSELPTLRGISSIDDKVQKLSGMLRASTNKTARNILTVSCEGPYAEDTKLIADAASAEFEDHQEQNYKQAVSQLTDLLQKANRELRDRLDALEAEYSQFIQESELQLDGTNLPQQRLASVQSKISEILIVRTELVAELNGLEEAIRDGLQRDAMLMLIDKYVVARGGERLPTPSIADSDDVRTFQALMPLLIEESMLSLELGPRHPKMRAIRERIETTRNHMKQLQDLAPDQVVDEEGPKTDFMTIYLESLRQEIKLTEEKEDQLLVLANRETAEARRLRDDVHERNSFERRIARETSMLEEVQQQMRDTELPTNTGGVTTSVLTGARYGSLIYPSLTQFLGMGAFCGALVGLALGYIVEVADRSFRRPDEIVREFGLPIVGHTPYMQEQKLRKIPKNVTMDRTVIAMHLPRSRPSEAYRTVRTAVCFSAVGSQHRVIQVTSPAAGDGKSTLTANLAVSLAQSGKKTILIESDFRRPKVHKLMGVSNETGVVNVLRGDAEISDAIQTTELENFDIMPCGSRPKNPSELITRPEYEQLLEALRAKYEYVIIDTPPVLVVTDPCSVAPRTDGVLLCIRLGRHTREFGRRALEQLRDVGANITGLVVNGVEETDAYGYGNYSYSDYRYRYKDYNYGYESYQESGEAYFAESEEESSASIGS